MFSYHVRRSNLMLRWSLIPALLCGLAFVPSAPADDAADPKKADTPVVAHLRLTGDLDETPVSSEGLFGAPGENLKSKLDRLRKAAKDDKVKAVYLELGGL